MGSGGGASQPIQTPSFQKNNDMMISSILHILEE